MLSIRKTPKTRGHKGIKVIGRKEIDMRKILI